MGYRAVLVEGTAGSAYLGFTGDNHLEVGYSANQPDAMPDEINTHVRIPLPATEDPPYRWAWLRLKKDGRSILGVLLSEELRWSCRRR